MPKGKALAAKGAKCHSQADDGKGQGQADDGKGQGQAPREKPAGGPKGVVAVMGEILKNYLLLYNELQYFSSFI